MYIVLLVTWFGKSSVTSVFCLGLIRFQINHSQSQFSLSLCFVFLCFLRPKEGAEESSGEPVPVSRGKKRSSGSYLDDKSQVSGFHPASEPATPQKRPTDGAASSEVCHI